MSILQLQKTTGGSVIASGNVIFDETLEQNGEFSYNAGSGEVTVSANGTYVFDWWVVTQTTPASDVAFNLNFSGGAEYKSNSPIKTGATNGFAILEVTNAPITVTLTNANASNVFLSSVPVKAELRAFNIITVTSDESNCFAYDQLLNVLEQIVTIYNGEQVLVSCGNHSNFQGTLGSLYTAPGSARPTCLVVNLSGVDEYISIKNIDAVRINDGVYDDSITYLPLPDPFIQTCNNEIILGYYGLAEVGLNASVDVGPSNFAGEVYENEYGMIVMEDSTDTHLAFIVTTKILSMNIG